MTAGIVLPVIDVSGDDGDPGWAPGNEWPATGHGTYRWLRRPGLYTACRRYLIEGWTRAVAAYEAAPGDFHAAWTYLDGHPMYWTFRQDGLPGLPWNHFSRLDFDYGITRGVMIDVVKVSPASHRIEDNPALNTLTEVWVETGMCHLWQPGHTWHDYELDCGGPTVEAAVTALAARVRRAYGDDRRVCARRGEDGPPPDRV